VWGATKSLFIFFNKLAVSIHAPVWGATTQPSKSHDKPCFNPRTRVGCDYDKKLISPTSAVSIHAPVWGATKKLPTVITSNMFQSTHPCGVRRRKRVFAIVDFGFNPRTRVGCDASAGITQQ